MASPQHKIAQKFVAAFEHLSVDDHLVLRTPGCTHTMAPTSLNMPVNMTNNQFATHLSSLRKVIATFPVIAKEIFTSEGSNVVTVWATSEAFFKDEAKKDSDGDDGGMKAEDWEYRGEYVFILTLNVEGDGLRIERVVEFLDSVKVVGVRGLIERAKRNVGE